MDLYRLSGTYDIEFSPLNLDHVFSSCVSLVEWPVRLPNHLVPKVGRLDIDIRIADKDVIDADGEHDATRLVLLESDDDQWAMKLNDLRDEGLVDDLLAE